MCMGHARQLGSRTGEGPPGQQVSRQVWGDGARRRERTAIRPAGKASHGEGVDGRGLRDGAKPTDELSRESSKGKQRQKQLLRTPALQGRAVPHLSPPSPPQMHREALPAADAQSPSHPRGAVLPPAGDTASEKDLSERRPSFQRSR